MIYIYITSPSYIYIYIARTCSSFSREGNVNLAIKHALVIKSRSIVRLQQKYLYSWDVG